MDLDPDGEPFDAPELIELAPPTRGGPGRGDRGAVRPFVAGAACGVIISTWLFVTVDAARNPSPGASPSPSASVTVAAARPSRSIMQASTAPSVGPTASPVPIECPIPRSAASIVGSLTRDGIESQNLLSDAISRGALVTQSAAPDEPASIWVTGRDGAGRIATVGAPGVDAVRVDDVSRDARFVLVDVGVLHISIPRPSCDDEYLLRVDRPEIVPLTSNGPDQHDSGGRISPDGRWVAMVHDELTATSAAFRLIDLVDPTAPSLELCGLAGRSGPTMLAWSPDSRNLAVLCGSVLEIRSVVGIDGTAQAIVPARDEDLVGIGWPTPTQVVLVSAVGGTSQNGPVRFRTLGVSGAGAGLTVGSWSAPRTIEPELAEGVGRVEFSPDGRSMLVLGTAGGPDGLAWYAVDLRSGRATKVSGFAADGDDGAGWADDGRSTLWLNRWTDGRATIVQTELATGRQRIVALPPLDVRQGLFR